ncbi:hypothetical protein IQ279_23780 [Streptomyces verrucosisporus]|uniref:hypothetical protein n=1 Tax=Streptomyces verrucosisporus TaxID=1695161 RepID=UPI0019CF8C20|nr:hypothetical protein [Streptomyces verrucosisporus]MBN3932598.1 hypothetical protein [Streptomyces verrucosisporus]
MLLITPAIRCDGETGLPGRRLPVLVGLCATQRAGGVRGGVIAVRGGQDEGT